MSEITPDLIKALREKTGAGMMDCKKALLETEGAFDDAVDWLRKKGLAAAAKKASRVAADGLVGVFSLSDRKSAALVEVNSETDFVARNVKFQDFVKDVSQIVAENHCESVELLKQLPMKHETVESALTTLISIIGENIVIRRAEEVKVAKGVVSTYVHSAIAPGIGKIGVVLALESDNSSQELADFGKKLAMHVAASNPQYVKVTDVPKQTVEHEKKILLEQVKDLNRPQNVMEKMIEGRIRKFYEEVVLEEQIYVMDGKKKVSEVVADFANKIGHSIRIVRFIKFVLGEGIEKQNSDFAEEVSMMAK